MSQLMTTEEVAEFCRVSPQAVANWVKDGALKRKRAGRLNRFDRAEVERFLNREQNETTPTETTTP